MKDTAEIIRSTFPAKKVVIIGDMVADQFLRGSIARVSREAPVFILRHEETDTLAGGAANAAVNVASLGGKQALIGLTGNDVTGTLLRDELERKGVNCDLVVSSGEVKTTTKVRVLAGQHYAPKQQVIRIDYENSGSISPALRQQITANIITACGDADAIIMSDYNYGIADTETAAAARNIAAEKGIPLIIDSRFRLKEFPGATSATPNQEEVEQILGKSLTPEDCDKLRADLRYDSMLVTCGNKGMILTEEDKEPVQIEAVGSKEPVDVTGAGDTVIAVYALGLASGLSFAEAADLANRAGGIVVMKKGTAFVTPDELIASLPQASRNE